LFENSKTCYRALSDSFLMTCGFVNNNATSVWLVTNILRRCSGLSVIVLVPF
jgi:hypothetical protein